MSDTVGPRRCSARRRAGAHAKVGRHGGGELRALRVAGCDGALGSGGGIRGLDHARRGRAASGSGRGLEHAGRRSALELRLLLHRDVLAAEEGDAAVLDVHGRFGARDGGLEHVQLLLGQGVIESFILLPGRVELVDPVLAVLARRVDEADDLALVGLRLGVVLGRVEDGHQAVELAFEVEDLVFVFLAVGGDDLARVLEEFRARLGDFDFFAAAVFDVEAWGHDDGEGHDGREDADDFVAWDLGGAVA